MMREIRTFVAVARHGSFAAAGLAIGLTPSAVGAQIRNLENELGLRLFDRSGRTAILNISGKRVLSLSEDMLSIFDRMSEIGDGATLRGTLKVGAIATVQTGILPGAVALLQKEAPALKVHIIPGVSLTLLDQVDAGEIDLALMIKSPFALPKDLFAEDLRSEEFVLIVPAFVTETAPLEIIENYPYIRYNRFSFAGRLVTHFLQENSIELDTVIELDEIEAIVRMVECGLGVSIVPMTGLWTTFPNRVRIVRFGSLTFYRKLQAVVRYAQRAAPSVALFLSCVKKTISSDLV